MSESEAKKYDQDKPRMDLIAPEIMVGLGVILKFGAEKYTKEYETEWDRLLDVQGVERIEIRTATGSVVRVTKKNSEELILNSLKDKDKIVGIGVNAIQTSLRNTPNVGRIVQRLVNEISEQSGSVLYENTDSTKGVMQRWSNRGVRSVGQSVTLTLTIATRQASFEESFVASATTDSDFWEMIWKACKEQLGISKPLNRTGERNWELGMDWSRPFGALMRHMWAWWRGGDKDKETGQSHLWHAACCIMFLIAYEERESGNDDRPRGY